MLMEDIGLDLIGRSIWQNRVASMQWTACTLLVPTISLFGMQELAVESRRRLMQYPWCETLARCQLSRFTS